MQDYVPGNSNEFGYQNLQVYMTIYTTSVIFSELLKHSITHKNCKRGTRARLNNLWFSCAFHLQMSPGTGSPFNLRNMH